MPPSVTIDLALVSKSLDLAEDRVQAVVELLDAGNTIPFITRYRKDQTGGLDEEQIRQIESRVVKLRLLAERKQTILRSIESQGKLTPKLADAIAKADSTRELEDLYLPFKPKKQTLATSARERGLEPLANEILAADPAAADLDARAKDFINEDKKVMSGADALLGAGHILAEVFAERADFRGRVREILERSGKLVSTAVEPEKKKEEPAAEPEATAVPAIDVTPDPSPAVAPAGPEAGATTDTAPASSPGDATPGLEASSSEAVESPAPTAETAPAPAAARRSKKKKKKQPDPAAEHRAFRDYFQYSEAIGRVPPHRILAINRGEKIKALRVKIDYDLDAMIAAVDELLAPADHPHVEFLRGCGRDALQRLVLPSLERDVRRELTDRAEAHAVEVFARNLRNLLLQPPVAGKRVLAIDPGFKSGCKLAALDEFGNPLEHAVIHLIGKEERRTAAKAKLLEMVTQHQLNVIAIGNGTGCRESEQWVSDIIAEGTFGEGVAYVVVNEAGASVYSTSRIGREEFPAFDATVRGAISIGRRLQDPLSELVKIDPANIGVGMYQHDVKAKHLRNSVDGVVQSCVNYVGVDLNTASPALLSYVSGLNQLTAQRVYDHRQANGPFKSREGLKGVSGVGDAAFVQAAGFLKIVGGDQPLDATWIHPESYAVAGRVLEKLGASPSDLADREKSAQLAQRTSELDLNALARELGIGVLTLKDIVAQLVRPGRDPRESLPPPLFKRGVLKLDDLTPGMELSGTVLNVVDFGAFVDIGLKDSGLVHISRLADKYVQDPHQVVTVGDIVKVWVLEVDKQRRRVSLTMIDPAKTREQQEQRRAARAAAKPAQRPPARKPVGAGAGGGRKSHAAHRPAQNYQPKRPPKPVVPLTKEMKEGKKPLRTFGDLAQFWELKQEEKPDDAAGT